MPTRLDEADFSYWDIRKRLVAAAIGTPHPAQPYNQFVADRREYLREWGITVANKTRAHLFIHSYREIPVGPQDADGRQTTTYIPDTSYGRTVPPTSGSTSEVEHAAKYPGTWAVVITYNGDNIAVLTSESTTLTSHTIRHRTHALADRWERILRTNAPGVHLREDNYRTPKDNGPDFDATLWTIQPAHTNESVLWMYNHPQSHRRPITLGSKDRPYTQNGVLMYVLDETPYQVIIPRPESPATALNPAPDTDTTPDAPATAYAFQSVA